jgi:hypothetical protein
MPPRSYAIVTRTKYLARYRGLMVIFVIVLLVLWLILSVVGFAIQGLVWLAIIGIILFVATFIIAMIRRAARRTKAVRPTAPGPGPGPGAGQS